jgi:hypothetical protein
MRRIKVLPNIFDTFGNTLNLKPCIMDVDKIIITNRAALKNKYGAAGFSQIQSAIKKLVKADKARNLISLLVFIDDPVAMKKAKGKAVTDVTDTEQNKNAVDSLYYFYKPDYLMLLGAQDIIPHLKFKIPIPDDDDPFVLSDVPYACDKPFSRVAGDFIAPGRVLGRLPDITGDNDPGYLVKLIQNSIKWKPVKSSVYDKYFALCVKWWQKSTKLSLSNIFQDNLKLKISPKAVGPYSKPDLGLMMHFYNCHGASRTAEFYGQDNEDSDAFTCFHSGMLKNKIAYGNVTAAECCYGALLYNPHKPTKIDLPISNMYLQNNAIAFVGSTTIAYGPADSQGGADYIAQYFLIAIKKGASSGRAFLEAQQRFVEKGDVKMDPADLKTIIQFLLLGDPSLSPVQETPKTTEGKTPVKKILNKSMHETNERKERRVRLKEKSAFIDSTSDAPMKINAAPRGVLKKEIGKVLKSYKFNDNCSSVYGFKKNKKTNAKRAKSIGIPAANKDFRYHIYSKKRKGEMFDNLRLLVIQEADNKIMEIKEYVRR